MLHQWPVLTALACIRQLASLSVAVLAADGLIVAGLVGVLAYSVQVWRRVASRSCLVVF